MRVQVADNPSIRRRFFRLSVLNVLSNVTVPMAGLVDTAMLGHLPDIRFLAGVALAGVIFDVVYWGFGFLRMGTTGPTAQAVGRGDLAGMHRVFQRSMVLALAGGALLVIFRDALGDLSFYLLSGEPGVEAAGRAYYDARIWGAPAVLANLVFLGWFLGREESSIALAMTAVANLANISLNYVFIVRLGLAAQGAGLATMLSQYLSLAVALAFYLRRGHGADWRRRQIFDRRQLIDLLRLHADIFIRSLCIVTAFALFTNFSALLGTTVLIANTLLLRIFMLMTHAVDGIAYSTESLAGILYGERRRRELRRLLNLALACGVGIAGSVAAIVVLAPRMLLRVLTSHLEVIELAEGYRWWFVLCLLAGAVAFVYDGYFLGLTAGRTLRNAMLVSLAGVFLPLACGALVVDSPQILWLALGGFMVARVVTLSRAARLLEREERPGGPLLGVGSPPLK